MEKTVVPPGRLDILSHEMLKRGLKLHGNPMLRIVAKMAENHIGKALTETLGPASKPGQWAKNIIDAADEFEREYVKAQRRIEQEGD